MGTQRKIPTEGDIILTPYYADGWSDVHWIVIKTYPYCMLCRNLKGNGTIGTKTRCLGYGQRYRIQGEERKEAKEW